MWIEVHYSKSEVDEWLEEKKQDYIDNGEPIPEWMNDRDAILEEYENYTLREWVMDDVRHGYYEIDYDGES